MTRRRVKTNRPIIWRAFISWREIFQFNDNYSGFVKETFSQRWANLMTGGGPMGSEMWWRGPKQQQMYVVFQWANLLKEKIQHRICRSYNVTRDKLQCYTKWYTEKKKDEIQPFHDLLANKIMSLSSAGRIKKILIGNMTTTFLMAKHKV